MSLKGKPKLPPISITAAVLPPETEVWAKSADIPVNEPVLQQEPSAAAPEAAQPIVGGMAENDKPLPEAKSPVSLRLTPSVQRRLKRVLFQLTDRSGTRATLQELLEKFVMEGLKREEAKLLK